MGRGARLGISLDVLPHVTRRRAFEIRYKGCDTETQGWRGLVAREDV